MPTGDWQIANARPAVDRVLNKCVESESGCWIYQGASAGRRDKKYGRVTVGSRRDGTRRTRGAHEITYEGLVGDIPNGLVLDHYVCQTPLCCNPWHLEPVTQRENCRRMRLSDEERARRSAHMTRMNKIRWAA